MKVLIAEDDPVSALFLRRLLERMGHQVTVASDGEAAWLAVREGDVSLLISDWMMPRLTGLELCERVRSQDRKCYTYTILLTSRDSAEDKHEGLRAGADDFITKPLDPTELAIRLVIAERIVSVHEELKRQNARLLELATIDELTGVKNRRRFQEDLNLHLALAARKPMPLSLIMVDVDQFKAFNDEFGHVAGDAALRSVADILQSTVRDQDVVARYGGEEFVILLPATESLEAQYVAERLRLCFTTHEWPLRPITASLGVATSTGPTANAQSLVEEADQALYESKRCGRNRVTVAPAEPPSPQVEGPGFSGDRARWMAPSLNLRPNASLPASACSSSWESNP
jgi:diguanylate cyclase (GGDEF)-like protein